MERRRRALGEDDIDTLQSMSNLGTLLLRQGKYAEAQTVLRQAYEKRKVVLGADHVFTLGTMSQLSSTYERQDRFAEALPLLTELCKPERLRKVKESTQTMLVARLGRALLRSGKPADAEPVLLQAWERTRASDRPESDTTRVILSLLAEVCDRTNRPEAAAKWRAQLASLPSTTRAAD